MLSSLLSCSGHFGSSILLMDIIITVAQIYFFSWHNYKKSWQAPTCYDCDTYGPLCGSFQQNCSQPTHGIQHKVTRLQKERGYCISNKIDSSLNTKHTQSQTDHLHRPIEFSAGKNSHSLWYQAKLGDDILKKYDNITKKHKWLYQTADRSWYQINLWKTSHWLLFLQPQTSFNIWTVTKPLQFYCISVQKVITILRRPLD